ncbi:hypothetical protein [Nonomuraea sp. NPDC049695]|uniref:hypothetical protein n=1 Tax=Nonomuraea sp. NPDC049695 TaxID=3154734 RepID=UPI003435E50F
MAVAQPRATSDGKKQYTLDLPMMSIQVRQPDVRLPHIEMPHMEMPRLSRQELGHYMDVARTFLPAPERMAYYGALGALAVFGVLEWPVAAAIGAGTVIAQRRPRQTPMFGRQPSRPQETAAAAKEPTPPSGRAATTRRGTATTRGKAATTTAGAGGRKTTAGKTTAGKTTAGKTTAGKTTAGKTTSTSTSRRKSTSPSK